MLLRILAFCSWLNVGIILVLTAAMLAIMSFQVFMRSVMNAPPSWTEEVALACFTWTIMLGIAQGVRQGIHVRIDLLIEAMPARMKWPLECLVLLGVGAVGVFVTCAGWNYMNSSTGSFSAAVRYPMEWLYASAPVAGVLMTLFTLEALVRRGVKPVDAEGADLQT